jgi:hypothetical protein
MSATTSYPIHLVLAAEHSLNSVQSQVSGMTAGQRALTASKGKPRPYDEASNSAKACEQVPELEHGEKELQDFCLMRAMSVQCCLTTYQ